MDLFSFKSALTCPIAAFAALFAVDIPQLDSRLDARDPAERISHWISRQTGEVIDFNPLV
jgi:hypothetical protein